MGTGTKSIVPCSVAILYHALCHPVPSLSLLSPSLEALPIHFPRRHTLRLSNSPHRITPPPKVHNLQLPSLSRVTAQIGMLTLHPSPFLWTCRALFPPLCPVSDHSSFVFQKHDLLISLIATVLHSSFFSLLYCQLEVSWLRKESKRWSLHYSFSHSTNSSHMLPGLWALLGWSSEQIMLSPSL